MLAPILQPVRVECVICCGRVQLSTGDHIQYWAKPQPNNTVAILIINNNLLMDHDAKVDLSLVDVHCSLLHPCIVHDIWLDKDLPFKVFGSTYVSAASPFVPFHNQHLVTSVYQVQYWAHSIS
jgi:hypothetical protein